MSHLRSVLSFSLGALMAAGGTAVGAAEVAPGSGYVYRLVNGYSKEARGHLHYRVEKVDANSITVTVTPENAATGFQRTEVYTKDGNSLRRLMESHGEKVEYQFSAAYPAFVFPLDPGKSWSVRVNATVPGAAPGSAGVRSVRVDGTVLGTERIRVPAGEFDTVKVKRLVYPGDAYFNLPETKVTEVDWYAPALGRSVRTETRSEYLDMSRCGGGNSGGNCIFYGDWDVYELVNLGTAKR